MTDQLKMIKEGQGQVLSICLEVYADIDKMEITPVEKWIAYGATIKNLMQKFTDSQPKPIPDEG